MLIEVLTTIVSLFLICWSCAAHPTRVTCPSGWWMPEPGHCRRVPPENAGVGPRGGYVDLSVEPPGELVLPLYCTGGTTFRQDGTSAWCQR